MRGGGNSLGLAAAIYEECTFFCRNFTEISFSHCPREANMAAHVLASHSEGPLLTVWQEEPPDFICAVIADDVSIIPKQ